MILVFTTWIPKTGAAVCTDATHAQGPRACDSQGFPSYCPLSRLGFSRADYSSVGETWGYLGSLDALDSGDYLERIPLGFSPMLDLSIMSAPASTPVAFPWFHVVRVTSEASAFDVVKPVILLTCGVHAHEWIPQETCLGYVDYLVKAANGRAPYASEQDAVEDMLNEVEIWVVIHANPGGRMRDEHYDGMHNSGEVLERGDSRYPDQRKNAQWPVGFECGYDWVDEEFSGNCIEPPILNGPLTDPPMVRGWREPDSNHFLYWNDVGNNVTTSFSHHYCPKQLFS